MIRPFILLMLSLLITAPLYASDGLITIDSQHSVEETADRLESVLVNKGMTIFIRIDHSQGALSVGKELRPTVLVIFGNPRLGTVLMQCNQAVGIDLPQKALIWEDDTGQAHLSYNDPGYLADRHSLAGCSEAVEKITGALKNIASKATGP